MSSLGLSLDKKNWFLAKSSETPDFPDVFGSSQKGGSFPFF
jgi:hypothetical protein